MRISDNMLTGSFIANLNKSREKIEKLRTQIAEGSKINKPSDSPDGTVKLLRLNNQLVQSETIGKNIENGLSFLKETTFSMETIQNEMLNTMTNLTDAGNAAISDLTSFSDKINSSIKSILDAANSVYDGKSIFGGTDFSANPYAYSSDGKTIQQNIADVSGEQQIKIAPNSFQKINTNGKELFGTILKQSGSLDASAAIGNITSSTTKIYDNSGIEYNFNAQFTKTAANKYDLSYNIVDVNGNNLFSPAPVKKLEFDPDTNSIKTIDEKGVSNFNIKTSDGKINFNFDMTNLSESSSPAGLSISANQKTDVFNTLLAIRDGLKNGIRPSDEQIKAVFDFNLHILNKIAQTGNTINQLQDSSDLLANHQVVLEGLISKEQSVDIPKAMVDLQNEDYLLQVSLKISSTILPKSLLDYL